MTLTRRLHPQLPFRHFLTHDELIQYVRDLAASSPNLCHLNSLGVSREGREIPILTITHFLSGKPEDRPAYLIHGNIHAGELAGTHAALYTARQLLVDAPRSDLLSRVVFHIVPRINPDGAHFVATTAGRVRSRTDRSERLPNTLYQEDIDGNGLLLSMRHEHADGPYARDPKDPRLLVRRREESRGPFYRILPEGLIHDWDGTDRIQVEGRGFDWNRNWSYDWRPEPEQWGAGDFPFSEPEMRSLAEFIHHCPTLFGVLGYHTGPAAVLRPPSTGSDQDMDEQDVRILDDLARIGAKATGFPVIPVVKYHHARARDINLRGHFHNFGYHHLGLFVFEFELGVIQNSAGISTEDQLAVQTDEDQEALMRKVMRWWDRQKHREPLFSPWKPFRHPQLGQVDIGGFLLPHQANPTLKDLARIARGTYQFTREHARRSPRISLENLAVDEVGSGVVRIRALVANRGEMPTHVTNKGRNLRRLRPVRVEFHPAENVRLLSARGHVDVGHLAALTGSQLLEWFVSASGVQPVLGRIRVFGGTGGNSTQDVPRRLRARQ